MLKSCIRLLMAVYVHQVDHMPLYGRLISSVLSKILISLSEVAMVAHGELVDNAEDRQLPPLPGNGIGHTGGTG